MAKIGPLTDKAAQRTGTRPERNLYQRSARHRTELSRSMGTMAPAGAETSPQPPEVIKQLQ